MKVESCGLFMCPCGLASGDLRDYIHHCHILTKAVGDSKGLERTKFFDPYIGVVVRVGVLMGGAPYIEPDDLIVLGVA